MYCGLGGFNPVLSEFVLLMSALTSIEQKGEPTISCWSQFLLFKICSDILTGALLGSGL
jgi:hypothetical protein